MLPARPVSSKRHFEAIEVGKFEYCESLTDRWPPVTGQSMRLLIKLAKNAFKNHGALEGCAPASSGRTNGKTGERFAVCPARFAQTARLHVGHRTHAHTGHRREYGDLQRSACGVARAAALSGA